MSNNEILLENYELIRKCTQFQCKKYNAFKYYDDLLQDICVIILEYPPDKLNRIYNEKRMNCFITGILRKQLYSINSPFYKKYKKDNDRQISFSQLFNE